MRARNDSRTDKDIASPLEKQFREIVIGSGRSQEPYIIAFHSASDNISGASLGTLFGFFEVEIHDEDAAYIVNFLASVAKKEYFANPKRSPEESFESALHRINVALAEIVKHGNVSWLGHLHGALGAVSQNTLHFSVTGEGEIYLARAETIRSISAGLVESGIEPHPLKTFTEVSSGELFDADLVFALSPAVWSLFSPEDLERSLHRLGPAGFEQFLRTALVNELPIAAVAMVTCSAPVRLKPKDVTSVSERRRKETTVKLDNVWSEKPFHEAVQTKASLSERISEGNPPAKYPEKKSGHIYVQASADEAFETEESPWMERWTIFRHSLETKMHSFGMASRKVSRRVSKESIFILGATKARLSLLRRSLTRRARTTKRATKSRWQAFREQREQRKGPGENNHRFRSSNATEPITPLSPSSAMMPPASLAIGKGKGLPLPDLKKMNRAALRIVGQCRPVAEKIRHWSARKADLVGRLGANAFSWLYGSWKILPKKKKWLIIGVLGTLAVAATILVIPRTKEDPSIVPPLSSAAEEGLAEPIFPPADEPLATLLSGNRILFPTNNSRSIILATINESAFVVTERAIVNLKTQESITTPEPLRLATGMDDLDAIFVLGESGSLYFWSTVTKKFEKNTLPLPAGSEVSAIGSYLTYLYVLDQNTGTVYRFPRTEGGFGVATTWSKEPIHIGEAAAFAVHENILSTDTSGKPVLSARGRNTLTNFSEPLVPLSISAVGFDTRSGDIIALDRKEKRLVRWSATGILLGQYYHESFADIEAFSVSTDGNEVLVSRQGATSAWRIR